ncbi:MAG TPA: Gx transporter family protein [Ruminiclostridium sp.]|nr:Gx transporter family protein [Ruminiclostridium sp.]
MRFYIKNSVDVKKMVLLAVLTSQALVLSVVESWFPVPVGIPGIKLGLSNIITIAALIFFSLSNTLAIVLVKCVLSSLFMGGPVIFAFSICGGILSTLIMWLLLKYMDRWLSLIGISIAGSIAHNIGQITVACFIMSDLSVIGYLPVLLFSGIIMGIFVGMCSTFLVRALKKLNIIANL